MPIRSRPVRRAAPVPALAVLLLLLAAATALARPGPAAGGGAAGSPSGPAAAVVDPRPAAAVPFQPGPASRRARTGDGSPAAGWLWPLRPTPAVVAGFAPGPHPWSPGHRGVDLAGPPGAAVLSSGAGSVVFAGVLAGRGVVSVEHAGGLRTTYEPVLPLVHRGDRVAAGSTLGTLTVASSHCPPRSCLHWGARRGDAYLDPLALLDPGPVALLPLGGPQVRLG